jgi:hypothetical protein
MEKQQVTLSCSTPEVPEVLRVLFLVKRSWSGGNNSEVSRPHSPERADVREMEFYRA